MKTRNSSFYPIADLSNKENYKEYKIIERDGTILKRVFLDIPDDFIRERIICLHYLKNLVKLYYKQDVGFNIIGRDDPWDFKIDFSTDEIFNIEITSIADDTTVFERLKREERFKLNQFEKKIPIYELEKISKFLPDKEIDKLIASYKNTGLTKQDIVDNPYENIPHLFISSINPEKPPLERLIQTSIEKKEAKRHAEKEKTVLLIDNRTMLYEITDFYDALKAMKSDISNYSFREIWFYTGYYSSLDANDAEYSLAPIKITKEQEKILDKMIKEKSLGKNGILYT